MQIDRRKFIASGFVIIAAGCGKSPAAPDAPEPQPPSKPNPNPAPSTSQYGTLYKEGFAGIKGTAEEVLVAARLNPTFNKPGKIAVLTHLDGRAAPTIPGWSETYGYYIILVNGQYVGNSLREVELNKGDHWSLYDWNGKV